MLRGLILAELQWLAVAASAGATGFAMAVYAYDWARRSTLPHPVSWLIWDLVYAVLLTALWLRGARWSLVPVALILVGNLVITVLAVKRGTGHLGAGEKSLMACCAVALGAWCLVRDATAAAALAVSVELAAAVPTTVSAWRDRAAESLRSWRWGAISGMAGAAAVAASHAPAVQYLWAGSWVLMGAGIPAVALLGEWARKDTGR